MNSNITILDMGYPTKVQFVKKGKNQQWYINLPVALARAMDFAKGEVVEWEIVDRYILRLERKEKGEREQKGE